MSKVSTIRNIGPAGDAMFAKIGIITAEEVIELGADEAYSRLLAAGIRPHFIGYYALVMGLHGRPWNDCQGKEKEALRKKFDAIKAKSTSSPDLASAIEQELDAIGVGKRKSEQNGDG